MTTYTAIASRGERFWLVRVPGLGTTEDGLPTGAHLRRADELRTRAAQAQSQAANEYRAAAHDLQAAGLTVRDIGKALHVSHQRVSQLLDEPAPQRGRQLASC